MGLSRGELRKVLAVMEGEGRLTRHVGRGTFLTEPVLPSPLPGPGGLGAATSPRELDEARAMLEPALASLAAYNASARDIETIRSAAAELREAVTWARYDEGDLRFHRLVAEAAGNGLLLALHDLAAEVRRTLAWGRLAQKSENPGPDHPTHAEHAAIVDALSGRDPAGAAEAVRHHLMATAALR